MAAILPPPQCVNTLRPEQNGGPFTDDTFYFIEWKSSYLDSYFTEAYKGPTDNKSSLSQVTAWHIVSSNGLALNRQKAITFRKMVTKFTDAYIDGILPKGPNPPCLRMADRALLAGYPRYASSSGINVPNYD